MRRLSIGLAVALGVSALSAAEAAQYNKRPHLHPGAQAKISRVIAKAGAIGAAERNRKASGNERKCGQRIDGVIVDKTVGGEKLVVVTKDIVNAGGRVEIASDCQK